ncbi:BatD family protein [Mameliella alba]|uniref:BatD family protein n=1 Tax=Mameliella alba TaxID=561184 RepID=UPI000B5345BE|nr:BatD family protein [Mameliella alba]OWV44440.1 hypothetical protein CDZ95_07090 [Mameliella alba]
MVRWLALLLILACPLSAQEDALRLELVLDPRETAPVQGEMILATIRGVYRRNITNEELKLRPMTDFDWTRLGQDSWTDQRIDGLVAKVFERRIALYPRRAGALEVLPIAHELQLIDKQGHRDTVLVRTATVRIDVAEKPAGAGDDWLPVRALELSDSWDADAARLEDGQSVKRRVVLRALGATPEMMPHQPPLREPWLITFSPPAERDFQVTEAGPVTTLVWTWSLRPITGEPGVLPEVTIPYFDTALRQARTVTLPATPIGYASFSANAASGWRKDLGIGQPHLAIAVIAFLVVLVPTLRGRAGASGMFGRWRSRWRLRSDLHKLRRHAAKGETALFRTRAQRLLETEPTALERVLRPVDATLFGAGKDRSDVDLRSVLDDVERQVRGNSSRRGGR